MKISKNPVAVRTTTALFDYHQKDTEPQVCHDNTSTPLVNLDRPAPRISDAPRSTFRLFLRLLFPRCVYNYLRCYYRGAQLLVEYSSDICRFWKSSSAVHRGDNREKLEALITMGYHSIEKGLSLSDPRPHFGRANVLYLLSQLDEYTATYGWDHNSKIALNAVREYCAFNRNHNVSDSEIEDRVETLSSFVDSENNGVSASGVRLVNRTDLYNSCKLDLLPFFSSRCSIRQFSGKDVDKSLITQCVLMAQKSPSVCNRQSTHVTVLCNPREIASALEIQRGAKGFSSEVNKLLIVTSELASFQSSSERNQSWVDSGMFAMSLVYALHSLGLASCCLTCGIDRHRLNELRKMFDIPGSHVITMMIAVGYPPEHFAVAQSTRKPLEDIFTVRC